MRGFWRRATVFLGLLVPVTTAGARQEPASLPIGRWRVSEKGPGLDPRLNRLEVRPDAGRDRAVVVVFEVDDRGEDRVWGSARLASKSGEGAFEADWLSGSESVRLRLRPEADGSLTALIRRRDRNRPEASPERVRQVRLESEPGSPPAPAPARRDATRNGRIGLYAIRPDGSGLRLIAAPIDFERAGYPAWSPDGRKLAFAGFDATGRDPLILVVDARGGPPVAVASGIAPCWSHDGRRIAYVASGKVDFATDWGRPGRNNERIEAVQVAGPDAGRLEVLARGLWPRFAPNDDRLAFVARLDANWDIYLRSADGAGLARLTDDPANDSYPTWTRDGSAVIFLSDRGNRWDLWRSAADGGGAADRLTDHRRREEQADLAPDGRSIVFTDRLGRPDSRIMILELASGRARELLGPPFGDRDPAWSPDGRAIAFVGRRAGQILPAPDGRK